MLELQISMLKVKMYKLLQYGTCNLLSFIIKSMNTKMVKSTLVQAECTVGTWQCCHIVYSLLIECRS